MGSPTWVGLQCPTLPPQVPFSLGSGCSETVGCCFSPFPTRWGPSLYLSLQPGMGAQPGLSGRGLLTHRARPQPAGGGSHRGQPGLARAPCARGAWPTPSAETRGPFRAPGPAPKPPPGSSPQRGHAGKLGVDPAQLPKASLFPCPPPARGLTPPSSPLHSLCLACLPLPRTQATGFPTLPSPPSTTLFPTTLSEPHSNLPSLHKISKGAHSLSLSPTSGNATAGPIWTQATRCQPPDSSFFGFFLIIIIILITT